VDFAIGFLRRRAATFFRDGGEPPLAYCPQCASSLVQPCGWKELPGGGLVLHLRCPECQVRISGCFEHERVAEYDSDLLKGREAIEADYDAIVRHNMGELSASFERALELDLISADDFKIGSSRADHDGRTRPPVRVESRHGADE
jgi:hypothetical protein